MAKSDPAAAGATPEKPEKKEGAGKRKKTFKKRGEKRIVHHGLAHIHASFNNTTVTITDTEGNVVACRAPAASASRDRARARHLRRRRPRSTLETPRRPWACARSTCA
jgi:hypothetical protein